MITDVISRIICKVFFWRDQWFRDPAFDKPWYIGVAKVTVDAGVRDPEIEIISILIRSEDQPWLFHGIKTSQIAAAQRSGYIFEGFIEIFNFSDGIAKGDHFHHTVSPVVIFRRCRHPDRYSADQDHCSHRDHDGTVVEFEDQAEP